VSISQTAICNIALRELGASRITSITDGTPNADKCQDVYDPILDRELRRRKWNFSIKRVILAPDAATPVSDFDFQFTWPADCIRPLPSIFDTDWVMEQRRILTSAGDTLELRYVAQVTDTNMFDPLFAYAFALAIAGALAEGVKQSTRKKESLQRDYKTAIAEAARANAFEKQAVVFPEDSWVSVRFP